MLTCPLLVWSINSLAGLYVYVACRSVGREGVTGDIRKNPCCPGYGSALCSWSVFLDLWQNKSSGLYYKPFPCIKWCH